jgi:myo-inositol-1(or 4)-monophosphatase
MGEDTIDRGLALTVKLVREAGALLMASLGKVTAVELKGEIDPVTVLDRQVEEFLVRRIGEEFPDHDFLAEEQTRPTGKSSYLWIIDPLDGTTNYAHGYPCFAISIALQQAGQVELGVILQPATGELFTAVRGRGACLNGTRLAVSSTVRSLEQAFLVTGFPYNLREPGVLERNLQRFGRLLGPSFAVRRDGSAAYDLACLAAGRFDGYWEENLKAWDTAAGVLMVQEAGGVVTGMDGGPFANGSRSGLLAAGSKELHAQILALLAEDTQV